MTQEIKLHYDGRMPRWLHVKLCNFLQTQMMSPKDCPGDLSRSSHFLSEVIPGVNNAPALAWLHEHGAYCDCEVILNTVPWGEARRETVH